MVGSILLDVVAPILLMIGCGALLRRRFAIDVDTLSKLTLYACTPAFIFDRVAHSTLGGGEMVAVSLATATLVLMLGGITVALCRLRGGVSRARAGTLAMAAMFYNSGNYGLPLSELAYPAMIGGAPSTRDGAASQTFVALVQNVMSYTLGLAIAAGGAGAAWQIVGRIARMPVLYTLALALLGHYFYGPGTGRELPHVIVSTTRYLGAGLVPVALVTLGAQLAASPRWPEWRPIGFAIVMRSLVGPTLMAGLLYLFHRQLPGTMFDLWPWPAEVLILTAGVPSAVNTLLLVLEFEGDARLTADTVFWTTVASAGSVLLWLVVLRASFGG